MDPYDPTPTQNDGEVQLMAASFAGETNSVKGSIDWAFDQLSGALARAVGSTSCGAITAINSAIAATTARIAPDRADLCEQHAIPVHPDTTTRIPAGT